jgi:glycosyltransferase involved in cell wall biosynthesis
MGLAINVLSYVDPARGSGGGELAVRALLDEGARRGHILGFVHRYPRPRFEGHTAPDFTLMVDVWNLPGHWLRLDRRMRRRARIDSAAVQYAALVDEVVRGGRFIHHDNAYVDVCSRPYLPCNGEVTAEGRCPLAKGRQCHHRRDARLYRAAAAISFVSPLHARVIRHVLGEPLPPTLLLRPVIDAERFAGAPRVERDLLRLFVGPLNEAKGALNMQRRYPDGDVWCVGGKREPLLRRLLRRNTASVDFGRPLPRVDYEDIPRLLSRAQKFVFLPRWPEPQGRVVIEAALCGCELETNEQVGALSFSRPPNDPALCIGAAEEWWAQAEELALRRVDALGENR